MKTHSLICVGCRRDGNESANCIIWDFKLLAFLISIVFGGTEGQTLTSLFRIPVHPVSWPGQPQQGATDRWDQPGWDHYQCRQTKPHSSSWKPEPRLSRIMILTPTSWKNLLTNQTIWLYLQKLKPSWMFADDLAFCLIHWPVVCSSCWRPCCVAVKAVISTLTAVPILSQRQRRIQTCSWTLSTNCRTGALILGWWPLLGKQICPRHPSYTSHCWACVSSQNTAGSERETPEACGADRIRRVKAAPPRVRPWLRT